MPERMIILAVILMILVYSYIFITIYYPSNGASRSSPLAMALVAANGENATLDAIIGNRGATKEPQLGLTIDWLPTAP